MFRLLISIACALAILPALLLSQNLLYYPESVVFDTLSECYLVSNWGHGNIVKIDEYGQQSNFNTPHFHVDQEFLKFADIVP